MAAEPAQALVIRGSDWSESSRIVTLWTREWGKIRGLAKGGRRLKSSFETAFDLLNVCHVMVIRKASSGLDLLTEAQVVERFPRLRQHLPSLYAGYYLAEILSDGTADHDPHPALYDLSLDVLRTLNSQSQDPRPILSVFDLAWLRELGYSPRLDACAMCGSSVEPPLAFSPTATGLVCAVCRPSASDWRVLTPGALETLKRLALGVADLPAGSAAEVRQLLGQIVSALLGRRPRLLAYVDGP